MLSFITQLTKAASEGNATVSIDKDTGANILGSLSSIFASKPAVIGGILSNDTDNPMIISDFGKVEIVRQSINSLMTGMMVTHVPGEDAITIVSNNLNVAMTRLSTASSTDLSVPLTSGTLLPLSFLIPGQAGEDGSPRGRRVMVASASSDSRVVRIIAWSTNPFLGGSVHNNRRIGEGGEKSAADEERPITSFLSIEFSNAK